MKLADAVKQMKLVYQNREEPPRRRFDRLLDLAAGFLIPALGRTGERSTAAILVHDAEDGLLRFVYPHHLSRGNAIPVDQESFAGRVLVAKQAKVWNDVARQPHRDFFERIPDPESGGPRTIQKMIAAPLLASDEEVFGVVEVNRTGATPDASGDDFTERDAANLAKCCAAFAPYLSRVWSDVRSEEARSAAVTG